MIDIDFYIFGETYSFHWTDATNVPRIGDYVKMFGVSYGDKLKVIDVTWITKDRVEILTER